MEEKPLDLQEHEDEGKLSVWKRRAMFLLLIGLCIAFAAPTFGSCKGALGSGGSEEWGRFRVGGSERIVREDEFRRLHANLDRVTAILFPESRGRDRFPDNRDREFTSEEAWNYLLLDESAKAAGVHVSDAQIRDHLGSRADFQTAGEFDEKKYRAFLREMSSRDSFDHETLTNTLRTILRARLYQRAFYATAMVPSSSEAYDAWKKDNVRVSADWVARPYADVEAKAKAEPVTEAELRAVAPLPEILALRRVPARRKFEVALILVKEVTPEQRKAMEEFLVASSLLPRDHTVDTLAWQWYWGNRKPGDAFSRETWLRWKRREHEPVRAKWEEEHKAWLAKPEAERGEEPKRPDDPALEPWPEQPREIFAKFFADRVRSEVLAREVIRQFALRAERETKAFADLAPDYAKFGLRVVPTEPLTDAELPEKFPEGLGRDSEVETTVRTHFRLPDPGKEFQPKIHPDPVPTTILADKIDARGFLVLRWAALVPARDRDVLDPEVQEKAKEFVVKRRTIDAARDSLVELGKKVEAAGAELTQRAEAFRKEAAAAGFGEVRSVRRFHRSSVRTTPPAGDAAHVAERRNRVVGDWASLQRTPVGQFREPVILDDATKAAYLILVTEHHEPGPLEMDESTLRSQRARAQFREADRIQSEVLSGEALQKRCGLVLSPAYLAVHKPREEKPAKPPAR